MLHYSMLNNEGQYQEFKHHSNQRKKNFEWIKKKAIFQIVSRKTQAVDKKFLIEENAHNYFIQTPNLARKVALK